MAQINLSVNLNTGTSTAQLKQLESSIKVIAKSFEQIKPSKELTSMLNAINKQYNALAKLATAQLKLNTENQKAESREALLNLRREKANTEIAKQNKLIAQTAKETRNLERAQEDANDKQDKTNKLFDAANIKQALIQEGLRLLVSALKDINRILIETETRLVSIQRVLPDGAVSDAALLDDILDLSYEYAQATENTSTVLTNFVKTGMDYEDALKATEAALLALNVAELDAEQATNGLIAIMQQFKLEASDLTLLIDKLNKTADQFPVDTESLLYALERTGSAAANANLSLDETIGLITSLSEATGRSGQNIGTAINSLIAYSSKASSLEVFSQLSGNTAQVVENYKAGAATILDIWRSVSQEMQSLDSRQTELLTGLVSSEEMESLSQELHDELGDIFETTSDIYGTANTFRKNYFIALLDNLDTVDKTIEAQQDAEGYSQKENKEYMETYVALTQQLDAEWQKFATNEQGLLAVNKWFVELGINILKVVNNSKSLYEALTRLGLNGLLWSWLWNGIDPIATAEDQKTYDEATEKVEELEKAIDEANKAGASEEYLNVLKAEKSELEDIIEKLKEKKGLETGEDEEEETEPYKIDYTRGKNYEGPLGFFQELLDTILQDVALQAEYDSALGAAIDVFNVAKNNPASKDYYVKLLQGIWQDAEPEFLKNIANAENGERKSQYIQEYNKIVEFLGAPNKLAKDTAETEEETNETLEDRVLTLSDVTGKYKDILEAVKQTRTEQKEQEELLGKQNDILEAQKELEEAIAEAKRDYVLDVMNKYIIELQTAETLEERQNAIIEARHTALLDYIKDRRKETEKETSLEEKKLAIEKARQALEDAKNQRNVRVFNAQTGMWEWQENERDVQSAQDSYDSAKSDLDKALEDEAYSEIEKYLANGGEDVEEIKRITTKILGYTPDWATDLDWSVTEGNEEVTKAVDSLNDYLQNQAISELKTAIQNGDTSSANINAILSKWLDMGEGSEIVSWGNALAATIKTAVASGYYDSNDVSSAQSKVEQAEQALVDYQVERLWDEVNELFTKAEGEKVSNDEFQKLITKYQGYGVPLSVLEQVIGDVEQQTDLDFSLFSKQIENAYSDQLVDPQDLLLALVQSGGVKNNSDLIRFIQETGITAADMYTPTGMIDMSKVITNNQSSNDNSTQIYINDIQIPQQVVEEFNLEEAFRTIANLY